MEIPLFEKSVLKSWRSIYSGIFAGAVSALVFALIHAIFISDIWFSLIPMMVAGGLCGFFLAWSYSRLVETPSIGSWLSYNLLYLVMFVLLGALSVLVYEPVATMAAVISANEPPGELIRQALPMTLIFTFAIAVLISLFYRRSLSNFAITLLTCTVLVLLLGLNVSTIGLVDVPRGSFYLIVEMFALILALNAVYVMVFTILERKRLLGVARG